MLSCQGLLGVVEHLESFPVLRSESCSEVEL